MYEPFSFSRRRFLKAATGLLGFATVAPLQRVFAAPHPPSNKGTHRVVMTLVDKDNTWYAQAHVGDDPTVAAKVVRFADAQGKPHRGIDAWFYADCVEAGATALDNAYDYINFKSVTVTYDGRNIPVPPSSKKDGTFDFWRGCRCPAIRYGKQVGFDPAKIDWSLFPSFALNPQRPWDDSQMDYSFNGLGCATTAAMGTTGARADIGYMPVWNMALLCNRTQQAWEVVRRAEDHIGGWGMVYTSDPDTGGIVDIHKYPETSTLSYFQSYRDKGNKLAYYAGSYDGETLIQVKNYPKTWQTTGSPMKPNGSHLTGYAMLAAMITGTARDRDHASFWANWPLLEIAPKDTHAAGVAAGPQRRFAWCLRSLFMASYVSSNGQYFANEVAKNLPVAMSLTGSPFGFYDHRTIYPADNSARGYHGLAPWQQYYLMVTIDAVWHKLPEWKPFADFLAGFIAQWHKYPFYPVQTIYYVISKNPDGSRMTDFAKMTRLSLENNGYSKEQANAVVSASTVKQAYEAVKAHDPDWDGKYANGVSDYRGNVRSPDSYPAMAGAATVCAINTGIRGMDQVRAYWEALPTRPDFSADGKFDLKLRIG